ncbi:MAG: GMC family oxidoreductase [Nitrospirae bacterium]|uniref:GMC oxidoreductase n=1 Tax=Candidatus Magnetobacterium casense TaxID=1455061 RepID=UPI0005911BA5|nr:GMC family oxidoreductase [Candidatus Magnetobacterium casensis]MBF0337856.1 GMC family oxidoreductase [Nitrospirota bacterium]
MNEPAFDAIVVGTGAGGAAAAWALSRLKLKVLMLESGPAYNPSTDYVTDKPQWEQDGFPEKEGHKGKYTFGLMQRLDERFRNLSSVNNVFGKVNNTGYRMAGKYHHIRGVGGSTLAFSGEAHRLNPRAMKLKSHFGVASDWPFDYDELERYYCIAEDVTGVSGASDGDSVRYRSKPYPLAAHKISYGGSKIRDGALKLGLSFIPNSLAILSESYDGRPLCNYCGCCQLGCQRMDKGSADVTFVRKALDSGYCMLRTLCNVVYIEAASDDRIKRVHYIDANGDFQRERGHVFVVSCGAVETPRLLLLSRNRYAPDGLCNESGMVGRNFMETLYCSVSGLHPEQLKSYRGTPADAICWDYSNPDAIQGVLGGCRFTHSTLELGFYGPISYAQKVAKGWGKQHKQQMRRSFGNLLSVGAIGEFIPNEYSYVDLAPIKTDEFGLPLPRINSYLNEMDLMRLKFMLDMSREILIASGVSNIAEVYSTYDNFNSTHVFGTCKMGNRPQDSVVNQFCQSHRWRNLFVVDSSVFPSSGGGASPSLTIEALAIRTAEYIDELKSKY